MTNSDRFNVVSENELSSVIAHFNTEFVMSIIDGAIQSRYNPTAFMSNPNIIDAWENNFKQLKTYYNSVEASERIDALRVNTYSEIIKRICTYHGLNFTVDDVDLYTASHYLYRVFVSNFLMFMDTFFATYIVKEADAIYEALGLGNLKKNKDTSTIYAKKVFKNPKIAIISTNIDAVVTYVCGLDIPMSYILYNCGLSRTEADYMISIIGDDNGNFFKTMYANTIMNDNIKPIRLNSIRFIIRNITDSSDEIMAQMAVQSTEIIDPVV